MLDERPVVEPEQQLSLPQPLLERLVASELLQVVELAAGFDPGPEVRASLRSVLAGRRGWARLTPADIRA